MPEPRPWPCPLPPEGLPDGVAYFEQGGWEWYADSTAETGVSCRVIPGGVADNEYTLQSRTVQALNQLEQAADNWSDLTAAEKDAAVRLAMRAVCRLARLVLRRFDATGG